MDIIYDGVSIPILRKRDRELENQIIILKRNDGLKVKIILSKELCKGSKKPFVSITNQLIKIYDCGLKTALDISNEFVNERILLLTINI